MRALIQRVSHASVRVGENIVGSIGVGALVLVGVRSGDTEEDARYLAEKIAGLRIYPDGERHFERSLSDIGGGLLVVSQFTLYGDTRKGRRPSFAQAAHPDEAEPLINYLVQELRGLGAPVETGRFGALMKVELVNSGPVTLMIESEDRQRARRDSQSG